MLSSRTTSVLLLVVVLCTTSTVVASFVLPTRQLQTQQQKQPASCLDNNRLVISKTTPSTSTALNVLLDVPEGFFTCTFGMLGILMSVAKNFSRIRMEELAWEQRLEEGRKRRLAQDPTLTELDLMRKEASLEWSAYGKPRQDEEELRQEIQQQLEQDERQGRRRQRVKTMSQDNDDEENDDDYDGSEYSMSQEEIEAFELEYGIDYDPYYDDPYTEDELPVGKYQVNKLYGDRIYENGEVFYRDSNNAKLWYRQGAKPPKSFSFF